YRGRNPVLAKVVRARSVSEGNVCPSLTPRARTKNVSNQESTMATTKKRNQILKGKHGGMQLVLTEDVTHLGKQGELVEVKAGYGRNYLLPNGLATLPTPHNLKLLGLYKERVHQAREAKIADLKVLAE